MGFSTYIAALMFIDTINKANTQSMIVAQDETNAKRIFQMIRRYYDLLPPHCKRIAKTDSKHELWWSDIDSYFLVGWAGSKRLGRGSTLNNVHFSESAFYEDGGELISGLQQSIPDDGNIFQESTANGIDNYFYEEYQSAKEGKSLFTRRFYPWFIDPSYRADLLLFGETFSVSDEEIKLVENVKKIYDFNLTEEQLIWRRNKITELKNARRSGGDSEKKVGTFPQEYPTTDEEAFLATGAAVFDHDVLLNDILPNCSEPNYNINIPIKYPNLRMVNKLDSGVLKIWKTPEAGHRYIISGDPSEGIKDIKKDLDYCSTSVVDYETWEQVATLHGRWEPYTYAEHLAELGWWFNDALLCILRANHGHSVLNTLINTLYYPEMKNKQWGGVYFHADYDVKNRLNQKIKKPGYPESVKTNKMLIGSLARLISDYSLKINSASHVGEMRLFSHLPGNKMGAARGHDDRVKDLALIAVLLEDPILSKMSLRADERKSSQVSSGKSLKRKGRMW